MASNFETSNHRGSDLFFDFSCYTCKGHKDRKLEILCEDHSELMCTACHVYNHKKCSHVVLIADKVKDLHQKGEFKQLSATLDTLHDQLIQKKDDFEESLKSLEQAYNTMMKEINALRKVINDSLDQLERNTIKELDTLLAKLKTSIQTDNGNCNESIKKITSLKEDWLNIKGKSEAIQMVIYRTCLDLSVQTKAVLQKMRVENDITLSFTPDPIILQTMATLSGLGQILFTENRVTTETKSEACSASSIKSYPEIQAIETNKQDLVTSPVSGTPRQAEIANQTISLNMLDTISNKTSVPSKQSDIANQFTAVNKSDYVSSPISYSSTQSNNTSALNKPGWMPNTVESSSSTQLVKEYQSSALDKSDPTQVIRVKTSKKYNVKIEKDYAFLPAYQSGICEIATGELLTTDKNNRKVKLLDQTMKVVAHYDLPSDPVSICSIDSSLVAVAMCIKEVHFIRVTNLQLVKDKTMEFQHLCCGITHHKGNLFITTDTALYQYTVDGRLMSKLHEDTRGRQTVGACAVSPDGERIYVTNQACKQLVTLSRDGTVISTLSDPFLTWNVFAAPPSLHVTDTGQVLVCGGWSNKIIQVDKDGRQILAEVVTEKECVERMSAPSCVYYSKHTRLLVVGMWLNNDILVFSTC